MPLNRDFDLEQTTGECSYCGHRLTYFEDQGVGCFLSCPFCDDYDQETDLYEWLEADGEEGNDGL